MKSRTLAISIVLLLIATATFPGLSFGLSSSITSYNNSISIFGDSTDYGLYKDAACEEQWEGPAFSKGIVKVNDLTGTYKIAVDQQISLNGSNVVYVHIPGEVGADVQLKIRTSYSGGTIGGFTQGAIPTLTFTLEDVETGTKESNTITWGSTEFTFTVSSGSTYSISMVLNVKVSSITIVAPDPILGFDFILGSEERLASNAGNEIEFTFNTGGLSITSGDHIVDGPFAGTDYGVSNGTVYSIENGNDHFWSKNSSANATIKTNDDSNFYLYADLGKGKNSFVVSVDDGIRNKSVTISFEQGQKQYLGLNSQGNLVTSTTVTGLKEFSGSIILTITAVAGNQGQGNYLDLFIIQVPKQTGGTS